MMHVAERQDYHLIDDFKVLLQNPENLFDFLLEVFLSPSFLAPVLVWSRLLRKKMNNDADLIFIAEWQQMIGFSNTANLFDLDCGLYSYLDFKKWSLSNF